LPEPDLTNFSVAPGPSFSVPLNVVVVLSPPAVRIAAIAPLLVTVPAPQEIRWFD